MGMGAPRANELVLFAGLAAVQELKDAMDVASGVPKGAMVLGI
jgi:hypothetical protein